MISSSLPPFTSSLPRFRTVGGMLLTLLLGSLALGACDSGGGESAPSPAEITLSFDEAQTFVAGDTVAAEALVRDDGGQPMSEVRVDWTVSEGGGSAEPAKSTTDAEGVSTTRWQLGTEAVGSDAQTLRAAVESDEDVSAQQTVSVNPGALGALDIEAQQTTLMVDDTTSVRVTGAEDVYGNAIEDLAPYGFTWSSSRPAVASVSAGEEADARATVRTQSPGTTRVTAASGGAPGAGLQALQKARGAAVDTVELTVQAPAALRGVWMANVDSDVFESRENIAEAMKFLDEHNFNVVFPVVWNNAATLFPSDVLEDLIGRRIDPAYKGRDPLQEVVEEAHKHGIAVIPWFEFGFSSSYNAGGGPIIARKPGWKLINKNGNLVTKNGFDWMNPYHPEVREFMLSLIMEVVNEYDIEGIQGDDRLPASPVEGGYSDTTKALYREDHGGENPPRDIDDPEWMQWRADILGAFGERVYDEVKAVDENLIVSWAPSPYPFGYNEYLQDYPAWIDGGYTDLVHPQLYRRDPAPYEQLLISQSADALGWDPSKIIGFSPGMLMKVGDYLVSPEDLKAMIAANREHGYDGEVFFFYEGLRKNDGQLADVLVNSYYENPAPLPFETDPSGE